MKNISVRLTAAAMIAALAAATANAEAAGSGLSGHKQQSKTGKAESKSPKADDKAYASALKTLPDRPYDPWRGVRADK
jgi:hypothetical protein